MDTDSDPPGQHDCLLYRYFQPRRAWTAMQYCFPITTLSTNCIGGRTTIFQRGRALVDVQRLHELLISKLIGCFCGQSARFRALYLTDTPSRRAGALWSRSCDVCLRRAKLPLHLLPSWIGTTLQDRSPSVETTTKPCASGIGRMDHMPGMIHGRAIFSIIFVTVYSHSPPPPAKIISSLECRARRTCTTSGRLTQPRRGVTSVLEG